MEEVSDSVPEADNVSPKSSIIVVILGRNLENQPADSDVERCGDGQRRLRSVISQLSDRVRISDGGQGRFSSVIRIPVRISTLG